MQLAGEIDRLKTVELEGDQDPQRLARIRMQDGEAATLKLGAERSAQSLGLEKGDRVRIEGTTETIQGRKVLVAESVSVAGEQRQDPGSENGKKRQSDELSSAGF